MAQYKDNSWAQTGFDEMRRYAKQGGHFGKELMTILQERVDAEQIYAKSLSKMAIKLSKACRETPGTIADMWRNVATEIESRSDIHRHYSLSLINEIVKPLRILLENQQKARKIILSTVEKSAQILSEHRTNEIKAKKLSHSVARDNEKLQDAMLDVRLQRSSSSTLLQYNLHKIVDKDGKGGEKDAIKLEGKRRKAEEAVNKAESEYYSFCLKAERARVEWELSLLKGTKLLQNQQYRRLASFENFLNGYAKLSQNINPSLSRIVDILIPNINACEVGKDLAIINSIQRMAEGPSEQLLPDFYCEHTTLAMNRERRRQALIKLLHLMEIDMNRERKSCNDLTNLSAKAPLPIDPTINDRIYQSRFMLSYLDGARLKLESALCELDNKEQGLNPLAEYIKIVRDKTGLQQSVLKQPVHFNNSEDISGLLSNFDCHSAQHDHTDYVESSNYQLIKRFNRRASSKKLRKTSIGKSDENMQMIKSFSANDLTYDRGIADGGSNKQDSDFDGFSSHDDDEESNRRGSTKLTHDTNDNVSNVKVLCKCRALYDYAPKLQDELELKPGDVIDVIAKQEDGWWLGSLNQRNGIFPATYVEEIFLVTQV